MCHGRHASLYGKNQKCVVAGAGDWTKRYLEEYVSERVREREREREETASQENLSEDPRRSGERILREGAKGRLGRQQEQEHENKKTRKTERERK